MTESSTPSSLRGKVADARASVVGTRRLRDQVARHAQALAGVKERLDRQHARIKELETLTKELHKAVNLDSVERGRRELQIGALEVRLADLEQRLDDALAAGTAAQAAAPDADALAQGRSLLEEIRAEHAQARARLQIISSYEERLRRVEETAVALYDGDRRHMI